MMGTVLKLDLDGDGPAPASAPAPAAQTPAAQPDAPPPPWGDEPAWEPDPAWLEEARATQLDPVPDYLPEWETRTAQSAASQPTPAAEPHPSGIAAAAVLYIDADNQSAQIAGDLVALFRNDLGVRRLSAVIASNNSSGQIDLWAKGLQAAAPQIEAIALDVPSRKDAADVALIMELGASLERHASHGDLVVVVSRDDLLVGAAERAKAHGCRAFAAYVDSDPPCARSNRVATILLPAPGKPRHAKPPSRRLVSTLPSLARKAPATPACAPASASAPPAAALPAAAAATLSGPGSDPVAVLASVRDLCKPTLEGGYRTNEVGQALKKLGFIDIKARQRFLASAPGIRTEVHAGHKVYVF